MTDNAMEAAARVLARGVGLRTDPSIRSRLTRAVRDEAASRGLELNDYVARLDADADALQALLNRVTVQETSFFRDPGQFTALAEHVLPPLAASGRPVTIWSAGCANGQEPYSLAMVLADSGVRDWRIIATDISTKALGRARQGRYHERELVGIGARRRQQYVARCDDGEAWEVDARLRERVTFQRHNLAADAVPFGGGGCQVVFCRNVLIYFGRDDVVRFIDRLSAALPSDGHLFLGYSESLWQVSERFHLVRLGDAFVYRKGPPRPPAKRATPTVGSAPRVAPAVSPAPAAAPAVSPAPASAPPAPPAPPRPRRSTPAPAPDSVALLATGEAAFGAGDYAAAIGAFRQAAFLDPDHPIAHLNLGLALESAGDPDAARRAYAAAQAALRRADSAVVEATLEGYRLDELARLLEQKTAGR